jgi:hypothetical protein
MARGKLQEVTWFELSGTFQGEKGGREGGRDWEENVGGGGRRKEEVKAKQGA